MGVFVMRTSLRLHEWKRISVILFVFLLGGCCSQNKKTCTPTLSEEGFIKIASQTARQYNLLLENYHIRFDQDNRQWEKFLLTLEQYDAKTARDLKKFFRCRCYQAVLIFPKAPQRGGGFWVFMDPKTGKLLKVLTEV
jgi:hypothetical protein